MTARQRLERVIRMHHDVEAVHMQLIILRRDLAAMVADERRAALQEDADRDRVRAVTAMSER